MPRVSRPAEPFPELVRPMLATAGALPPATQDERWAYEMKWDGVRAVTYVRDGAVRALSRNDRDVSAGYPELQALAEALAGRQAVLDGELVAFDERGRPSFGLLQDRMHLREPSQVRAMVKRVPVTYLVFDVLHVDGRSALRLPYDERRALLESLELAGQGFAVPPVFVGGGADAVALSKAQQLEGVLAKRRDSTYEPGARSECWVKVKNLRMQEVVIGGWKPGSGRRGGGIGSLLLGVQGDEGLVFVGHVGTGFSQAALRSLAESLQPLSRNASPFATEVPREHARDAQWVEPVLVGEVVFSDWTRDRRLRHPSWRGLRPDKDPRDVRVEPVASH